MLLFNRLKHTQKFDILKKTSGLILPFNRLKHSKIRVLSKMVEYWRK